MITNQLSVHIGQRHQHRSMDLSRTAPDSPVSPSACTCPSSSLPREGGQVRQDQPGTIGALAGTAMTPRVVGVDLSLRSTGVAGRGWVDRVVPPRGLTGLPRLRWIRSAVLDLVRPAELVVIEGLAFASTTGKAAERAGLWWLTVDSIQAADVPVAVVPPACRCRYATGRGNASKDAVLAATIRRYPDVPVTGNDEADALVLAAMGLDHLGCPLTTVPVTHRAALGAVSWPAIDSTAA